MSDPTQQPGMADRCGTPLPQRFCRYCLPVVQREEQKRLEDLMAPNPVTFGDCPPPAGQTTQDASL